MTPAACEKAVGDASSGRAAVTDGEGSDLGSATVMGYERRQAGMVVVKGCQRRGVRQDVG